MAAGRDSIEAGDLPPPYADDADDHERRTAGQLGPLSLAREALPEPGNTAGKATGRPESRGSTPESVHLRGDPGNDDRWDGQLSTMSTPPTRVLFVCTHNSARSQMAEALLRRDGGSRFEVESAGTEASGVHPYAVRVLSEVGIDWSRARSKTISEFLDQRFDHVVTVCDHARETCPVFPGSRSNLHWSLDDPAEVEGSEAQRLDAFRATRDEIISRLQPFIELARRTRTPGAPMLTEA